MYTCPHCKETKPDDKFQLYKGHPNGWCRECRTEKERERRRARGQKEKEFSRIDDGKKLCMDCKEMKPFSAFRKNQKGLGGLHSYCKSCFKKRYYDVDKAREATYSYRENNNERYKALHRKHQAKRRSQIEVIGDLPDEVVKKIYNAEVCHYCGMNTSKKERTLDHKIPLSRGGFHREDNVVMACKVCNTAKGSMTEKEFNDVNRGKGYRRQCF